MMKEEIPVVAVKFCDKKDVYFLSSYDGTSLENKTRIVKGNVQSVIQKLTSIDKYNYEMGEIDRADQMTQAYS